MAGVLAMGGMAADAAPTKAKVKHVILFIGDGMQLEHEIATSQYLFGKEKKLSFHHLGYSAPVSTWDVTTYNRMADAMGEPRYSRDAFNPLIGYAPDLGGKRPFPDDATEMMDFYFLRLVGATDSASAATAWATGYKTDDGNMAWLPGDPPDGALKTIAELMREQLGASIGVVSTVPFTHATPAAHVSHNVSRNNYTQIGHEIIFDVQPEVVIGGGNRHWGGNYLSAADQAALEAGATAYTYVGRTPGVDGGMALLAAADTVNVNAGGKLFGLFGGPGGNFESPVPSDTPGAPSIVRGSIENPLLADASIAALKVLTQDPDGSFVIIEQGDIDWANHANDFPRMIGTTWDLHDAVLAAAEFVNQPGDDVTWENTLMIVTADHSNSYMRLARRPNGPLLGIGDLPNTKGRISFVGSDPVYSPADAEVFYGCGSHTDELVMLYAHGNGVNTLAKRQGDWYPGTQILDNTQLFEAMAEAVGVIW
jgi:alkaline phosphatase